MGNVVNYVQKTVDLSACVNHISRHLSKHNEELGQLSQQLEVLFNLFGRGDELLKIIQQYSTSLQQQIATVKRTHDTYEQTIEDISVRMNTVSDHLQSITRLLKELHINAGGFVKSAQALGHLAKNTEIKAHHAHREGKGLGIIAKECLSLAQQAQLPFKDFSSVLESLEETAKPVMNELQTVIELSQWSRTLLENSFSTLHTIDDATSVLNNIVVRVDESSTINKSLRANVKTGLGVMQQQVIFFLNAIDDLSVRCSHIHAQANLLYSLSETPDPLARANIDRRRVQQFDFLLKENIRSVDRFSDIKKVQGFSRDMYEGIISMEKQILDLEGSMDDLTEYRENIGKGMSDVIELAKQVTSFFEKAEIMFRYLHKLGNDIHDEVLKIETLVRTTTRIFSKIKTLSTFARIEEGRSNVYRSTLASIVDSFVTLEKETEQAFAIIAPNLVELKKHVQFLRTLHSIMIPQVMQYPDYSKIKLFLDDIARVFKEERKSMSEAAQLTRRLFANNTIFEQNWQRFSDIRSDIRTAIRSIPFTVPAVKHDLPAIKPSKSRVTICLSSDPITLFPDLKTDIASHHVICNLSSGLFQYGEGVDVIPALCKDYVISEDGTEYTFIIREDLKFYNGKPLTIEHVKEAFFRALMGPNFSLFDMIIGAKEYIATRNKKALDIKIINKTTMKCTLEYPFLPLLANCATNIADPYLEGMYPIAAGPFYLVSYEKGKEIVLRANKHYFAGKPGVDELCFRIIANESERYRAYRRDELDILLLSGDALNMARQEIPHELHKIAELSVRYIILNCSKEPFNNVLVRKAVCHAIDADEMVRQFFCDSAIIAKGLFPPSMKVYDQNIKGYQYDPRLARKLLAQAGYANGLPDVYTFDVADTVSAIRRAEFVKASLTDIGIRVNINPMSWKDMLGKQYQGDSIISFGGWVGDNGDPDNFLYSLFHSSSRGHSGNTFFYASDEIDTLVDKARKVRNVDQRIKLYRDIERRILDQAPCTFLYHRLQNIAIKKYITGFKPHPLGFLRVQYVYTLQSGNNGMSKGPGKQISRHHVYYGSQEA